MKKERLKNVFSVWIERFNSRDCSSRLIDKVSCRTRDSATDYIYDRYGNKGLKRDFLGGMDSRYFAKDPKEGTVMLTIFKEPLR
jgi:hypothetical protein